MRGELSSQQSQSKRWSSRSFLSVRPSELLTVCSGGSSTVSSGSTRALGTTTATLSQNLFDDIGKVCDLIAIHITAPLALLLMPQMLNADLFVVVSQNLVH